MTDPKHAALLDQLSRLISIAARPMEKLGLPSPGGLAGLHELGACLLLRKSHSEKVKHPEHTLIDGGGDWDDIAMLLMAAARQAGISTRLRVRGSELYLEARQAETDEWETVGPRGSWRARR